MVELVGISGGYEYQHSATKIDNRIYVTRGNSKFAILFEQTTYKGENLYFEFLLRVLFEIRDFIFRRLYSFNVHQLLLTSPAPKKFEVRSSEVARDRAVNPPRESPIPYSLCRKFAFLLRELGCNFL